MDRKDDLARNKQTEDTEHRQAAAAKGQQTGANQNQRPNQDRKNDQDYSQQANGKRTETR